MRLGQLRELITIERATTTRDSYGGVIDPPVYATIHTVAAAVEPLEGVELFRATQIAPATQYKVTIRHLDGITSKDSLQWRGQRLELTLPPVQDTRRQWQVMYCKGGE